jgi:hypothetical protein
MHMNRTHARGMGRTRGMAVVVAWEAVCGCHWALCARDTAMGAVSQGVSDVSHYPMHVPAGGKARTSRGTVEGGGAPGRLANRPATFIV